MANMIPDIDPQTIENDGERAFYRAARKLPEDYTVLYSYKYLVSDEEETLSPVREADFIIVHPGLGYLVVEVKQGDIYFTKGKWHEFKDGSYRPLSKDPVEQARKAMFVILDEYKKRTNSNFPLKIRYALCFPECTKIYGRLSSELNEKSIFLFGDLDNLEKKILDLFDGKQGKNEIRATNILVEKILAPSFRVFSKLEDRINMFYSRSEKVLTEEQERIIEETELDKRKIFLGAAGTGKTFIAMEKARKLAGQGKKVLLTCFNKNLARVLFTTLPSRITAINFHSYLEEILQEKGYAILFPQTKKEVDKYYDEILPEMAFDYFINAPSREKFDAIIVDEGQDFKESWITCLESMLREDGEFYIFADPNQNLFNSDIEKIKRIPVSKHRLTRNLRNAEPINEWMSSFIPSTHLKSIIKGGLPVKYFEWETLQEERKKIEEEIGRLVSQGVQLKRITILSSHRKEKSSLSGVYKIKEWPLIEDAEPKHNAIRFQTIRSFKGLEADIVFLIGIKKDSRVCTNADIYVGGSRARFLLYVFHEKGYNLPQTI